MYSIHRILNVLNTLKRCILKSSSTLIRSMIRNLKIYEDVKNSLNLRILRLIQVIQSKSFQIAGKVIKE